MFAAAEDRIFTEWRVRLYAVSVAVAIAVIAVWEFLHGRSVIDPTGRPVCIDFCTIWVSGNFAASSDPVRVYDYPVFAAAQSSLVGPHRLNFPPYRYGYPPTFLFLTYLLGLMPYLTAFAVWTLTTLALYAVAIYAIVPRFAAVIAAFTPLVVAENVLLGNNGALTAALIGLSLVLMERQPWLSGVFIGLLTYKPQFGVLFPVALVASRNWRAFASAAGTTVILTALAAIAFGPHGWLSFIDGLRDRNASLSLDPGLVLTLQSVYGLLHWAGAGTEISWVLHAAAATIVAVATFVVWAKPVPYSLKAATLCVGSLAVTPYVQIYDLCVLSIAVAFLVRDGLARGFLPGERIGMLIAFAALFLLLFPIGLMIYALFLFLIARRIVAYYRDPTLQSDLRRLDDPTEAQTGFALRRTLP
jgi:arabinofuranan 3-O-arabinosyltransferase